MIRILMKHVVLWLFAILVGLCLSLHDVEACGSDMECMLKYGGDGGPAPVDSPTFPEIDVELSTTVGYSTITW